MYAGVITEYIRRHLLCSCRFEVKAKTVFNRLQECFRGPSMPQEQILQTRPFAVFTQHISFAENFAPAILNR